MNAWTIRGLTIPLERPVVMGILNVTPDSFSDGGRFLSPDLAIERGLAMLAEGADIIDVGGESTRPQGARSVQASEELRRIIPVIDSLARSGAVVSVDTVKSEVASEAIAVGARIVNDVSAMRLDPRMATVCARAGVGVILMHSRGGVEDMATYAHAQYGDDPVADVLNELRKQIEVAVHAGVAHQSIVVDPGIGFSKRAEHSLRMLSELSRFVALGHPVMVGASRKRFIGTLAKAERPADRVFGSVGAAVSALDRGARIFRAHDVAATRQALDVAMAIQSAGPS